MKDNPAPSIAELFKGKDMESINLIWNKKTFEKLKNYLNTILNGDREMLQKFIRYRNIITEIPMPRHVDQFEVQYISQEFTDTLCGNVFLNILSRRKNRHYYKEDQMMYDLVDKIIEFIQETGKKCDECNWSLFSLRSSSQILHYMKNYRLFIKYNLKSF